MTPQTSVLFRMERLPAKTFQTARLRLAKRRRFLRTKATEAIRVPRITITLVGEDRSTVIATSAMRSGRQGARRQSSMSARRVTDFLRRIVYDRHKVLCSSFSRWRSDLRAEPLHPNRLRTLISDGTLLGPSLFVAPATIRLYESGFRNQHRVSRSIAGPRHWPHQSGSNAHD